MEQRDYSALGRTLADGLTVTQKRLEPAYAPPLGEYEGEALNTQWIPLNQITRASFQRPYDPTWAARLAKEWNPKFYQPIEVTWRPFGGWWNVNGQHRQGALEIRHPDNPAIPVLCIVIPEMSDAEAAQFFSARNKSVRVATSRDLVMARLAFNDPDATAIWDIVHRYGFKIRIAGGAVAAGELTMSALETAKRSNRTVTYSTLEDIVVVLREAWGTNEIIPAMSVQAVAFFVASYHKHPLYSQKHLAERLSTVSPRKLMRDSIDEQSRHRVKDGAAGRNIIRDIYNYRRAEHNRLPPL